jgi:hypothetical protein
MSELETTIYVAIRTTPAHLRRRLCSKLPVEGDAAAEALAKRIVDALEGGYQVQKVEKPPCWHSTF